MLWNFPILTIKRQGICNHKIFLFHFWSYTLLCYPGGIILSFMETLYLVSQSSDRHNKNDTNLIRFTLLLQFSLGLSQGVLTTCFLYAYSARIIPVLNLELLSLNWTQCETFHECTVGIYLSLGCMKECYCHTRLHLGFSAKLRIWQAPACKMEPRSGMIMYLQPPTHHPPTHPPGV